MIRTHVFRKRAGTYSADAAPAEWPALLKDDDAVFWVECEAFEGKESAQVAEAFRMHPLEVEIFLRAEKRPRVQPYDDHLLIVIHSPLLVRREHRIATPEVDILLGHNFLVTYCQEPLAAVAALRTEVARSPATVMGKGPDALLYALVDQAVERYQPVLDQISGLLAGLEDHVIRNPSTRILSDLSKIKRELLALRRTALPQSEAVLLLSRDESSLVSPRMRVYFRDLHDRLRRIGEMVEMYRDIVGGVRDTYMSVISNRLNEIMKTLTIIATIMMPLTLISSIYGMNFRHMPELNWKMGYPLALLAMVVVAAVMLVYFRRKKWW